MIILNKKFSDRIDLRESNQEIEVIIKYKNNKKKKGILNIPNTSCSIYEIISLLKKSMKKDFKYIKTTNLSLMHKFEDNEIKIK